MNFKDYKSIPITFELSDNQIDSRFSRVKIWVGHVGKNLNKSFFSKDFLIKLKESIEHIPIVGFIEKTKDDIDFAGHKEILVVDVDGIKLEYLGKAYGFIPKDNNAQFETKVAKDGVEREYLTVEGFIWNKFTTASELLDVQKGQSLELDPDSINGFYDDKEEAFRFTEGKLEALCILGDNRTPAMMGSLIEKINFTAIKFEFDEMLKDVELEFSAKGGNRLNEFLKSLMAKYESVSEDFFNGIDLTKFETEESLEEYINQEIEIMFAMTHATLADQFMSSLGAIVFEDRWGDKVSKFSYVDHDDTNVYVFDRQIYSHVGMPYSMDGDTISIDYENQFEVLWQPRKKEKGVAGSGIAFSKESEYIVNKFTEKHTEEINTIKDEFESKLEEQKVNFESEKETLTKELDELKSEISELNAFKFEVEKDKKIQYVYSIENLEEDEKKSFVDEIDKYTLESLIDEIAMTIGKKSIKFSAEKQTNISFNFANNTENEDIKSYEQYIPNKKH